MGRFVVYFVFVLRYNLLFLEGLESELIFVYNESKVFELWFLKDIV